MKLYLKKFGDILTSRQLGKEAFAALVPQLQNVKEKEEIEVDFEGVITFSPSWGDEFITPLAEKYGKDVVMLNTNNPSVIATLELLEKIHGIVFLRK